MIISVINDAEKTCVFSQSQIIYLNDPDVLNGLYVNDISLVVITPSPGILLSVRFSFSSY